MGVFTKWHYVPDADSVHDADVIIGMAFGANEKNKGQDPGLSNEEIARIIYRLWQKKDLPVIAQREVAEALHQLHIPIHPALVISEPDNEFHIDSRAVLLRAWAFCQEHGFHTAVIAAHPAHILRCAWVAQKIGFDVRTPDVATVPYEPHSKQWWTRNRYFFFLWELKSRIGWKIRGYI